MPTFPLRSQGFGAGFFRDTAGDSVVFLPNFFLVADGESVVLRPRFLLGMAGEAVAVLPVVRLDTAGELVRLLAGGDFSFIRGGLTRSCRALIVGLGNSALSICRVIVPRNVPASGGLSKKS